MSVPLFFYPYVVDQGIPNAGKERDENWIKFAKYFGKVPAKVLFVDGGMLSNFPINIFHRSDGRTPTRPTFGARLSTWRDASANTSKFFGFVGAMIGTMRQIYDYDFILRNPDYKQLICHIDADKEYNWLDFNLSDEDQIGLFRLGATRAIRFLENFNWEQYKAGRS
jgi:NTE family protein